MLKNEHPQINFQFKFYNLDRHIDFQKVAVNHFPVHHDQYEDFFYLIASEY